MDISEENILYAYEEINTGYQLVMVSSEKFFQTVVTVKQLTLDQKHK